MVRDMAVANMKLNNLWYEFFTRVVGEGNSLNDEATRNALRDLSGTIGTFMVSAQKGKFDKMNEAYSALESKMSEFEAAVDANTVDDAEFLNDMVARANELMSLLTQVHKSV